MTKLWRTFFTFVVLLSFSGVAACGADKSGGAASSSDTLVVGTDPTYKPFGYKDNGQLKGVDADVAKAIGKQLGRKVKLQAVAFDGVIPSIKSGRLDAYMDINITSEREKQVSFTTPYITQYLTSVVRASDTTLNPTLDTLKKTKVGVASATAASSWAQENKVSARTYDTIEDAYRDLILGRVDAVVVESLNAGYYAKHVFPGKLRVSTENLGNERVQIAAIYAKGNDGLGAELNKSIDALTKDGTLDEIVTKWFGDIQH